MIKHDQEKLVVLSIITVQSLKVMHSQPNIWWKIKKMPGECMQFTKNLAVTYSQKESFVLPAIQT